MTVKTALKKATISTGLHEPMVVVWNYFQHKKTETWRYLEWVRNPRFAPPPHRVKQKILLNYSRRYGLKYLVESGTYKGDMIKAMKNSFEKIWSIELDKILFEKASDRFKINSHIRIIHGDSGKVLGSLIGQLDQPTLFWLDGHYSGGETAQGVGDTPILKELQHVLRIKCGPHVILIDDARMFGTDPDYPTVGNLLVYVKDRRSCKEFAVKYDVIRMVIL